MVGYAATGYVPDLSQVSIRYVMCYTDTLEHRILSLPRGILAVEGISYDSNYVTTTGNKPGTSRSVLHTCMEPDICVQRRDGKKTLPHGKANW